MKLTLQDLIHFDWASLQPSASEQHMQHLAIIGAIAGIIVISLIFKYGMRRYQ